MIPVDRRRNCTPKKRRESHYSQNNWFAYYAGYSDSFVDECISIFYDDNDSFCILDPWNGSGTTTVCAGINGITSFGFDINPAMFVISSAKMFDVFSVSKTEWESLLERNADSYQTIKYSDPLCKWFSRQTVRNVRRFETNVIGGNQNANTYLKDRINSLDTRSAYVYLCLFQLLRNNSDVLSGSNPTWIKTSVNKKVVISYSELCDEFLRLIELHRSQFKDNVKQVATNCIASSLEMPLGDESVDLIITSPPYCTRIDYAIYTQIENAIIGYCSDDIKELRSKMIGSPTIHMCSQSGKLDKRAVYCNELLEMIKNHNSKAASSYYFKTYKQYFLEMAASLRELFRVLKRKGHAVLVVQDSWFKDVHVDVPKAIMELGELLGLCVSRIDYNVKNNLVFINSKSRKYTKDKKAVESVLVFEKGDE